MNIYHELPLLTDCVITIGSFDGLHLGHQYLIREVQKIANENKLPFYLISFEPHPRLVLQHNSDFKLLQTWNEKTALLEQFGVCNLIAIPFTTELSQKSAEEFILDYILKPLNPRIVVLGYDHKFGKDRQGSKDTFLALKRRLGLNLDIIQLQEYMNQRSHISSTTIRQLIQNGQIKEANGLLGHTYELSGKVEEGKKLGRTLGYPTANILTENINKLIPALGVYYTTIKVGGVWHKAATSIGLNPTVEDITTPRIESHILDFEGDIYDELITLKFHDYLRAEKKYDNLEALKVAIGQDIAQIEKQ